MKCCQFIIFVVEDVNLKNKENASPSKMSLRERLFALQENMNNFDSSMPHKLPEKEKNLNQESEDYEFLFGFMTIDMK